jgi:hypothetical protein
MGFAYKPRSKSKRLPRKYFSGVVIFPFEFFEIFRYVVDFMLPYCNYKPPVKKTGLYIENEMGAWIVTS